MKRSRFSEEQIIGILKDHQAGMSATGLCRKYGIWDATFYTLAQEVRRHGRVGGQAFEGTGRRQWAAGHATCRCSIRASAIRWPADDAEHRREARRRCSRDRGSCLPKHRLSEDDTGRLGVRVHLARHGFVGLSARRHARLFTARQTDRQRLYRGVQRTAAG